ncbi:MAG: N-6 DNA methylase [Dehalococcoidia bacterium]|nr:N-6 DNA methylase [Dehalococcoidia bacterium]
MKSFENDRNKLRGGYYTPAPIARFLAQWAVGQDSLHVLEPSAGDGEIVAAAAERLGYNATITAVELDGDEAKKVVARGGKRTTVVEGDFFNWFSGNSSDGMYDAV